LHLITVTLNGFRPKCCNLTYRLTNSLTFLSVYLSLSRPPPPTQVLILKGVKHEVTFLCPAPDGNHIAVGYEDGAVRVFSLLSGESDVTLNGHKTAVTVIGYDALGARLVTGSRVRSPVSPPIG